MWEGKSIFRHKKRVPACSYQDSRTDISGPDRTLSTHWFSSTFCVFNHSAAPAGCEQSGKLTPAGDFMGFPCSLCGQTSMVFSGRPLVPASADQSGSFRSVGCRSPLRCHNSPQGDDGAVGASRHVRPTRKATAAACTFLFPSVNLTTTPSRLLCYYYCWQKRLQTPRTSRWGNR